MASDLSVIGRPVAAADLARDEARRVVPLTVGISSGVGATLYNFPPPTQGLSSLMILAIFDRLGVTEAEGFDYLHGLVEATKQAFLVRDRIVGDPDSMPERAEDWLQAGRLDQLAAEIDRKSGVKGKSVAVRGGLGGR